MIVLTFNVCTPSVRLFIKHFLIILGLLDFGILSSCYYEDFERNKLLEAFRLKSRQSETSSNQYKYSLIVSLLSI